ncbi:hypothetical protein HUB98_18920 [Paenibacillus barcinonensis]|uniref:Uncharacterized protein n=1 Tax=Paenibacillus barcinonensis TaxID=198119 RepID=A0A2V4VBW0_PAEBA|nr:hypothetical protein [Paenibacillus barcinonensis]PYE42350.1 hypothetical protein DFQ00_13934 [Paenibacillus barcinonensis]QKS58111.1 hypothetical protein HUB98_18920 [Paenibacillus barcinonensis]
MRKLSEVLVKSGVEIYRDIIPVALYSVGSSVVLVPILMFAPIPLAVLLLAVIYMPLLFGVSYAVHHRLERKERRNGLRDMWEGTLKGLLPGGVTGLLFAVLGFILWSTWWYYGGQGGMAGMAVGMFQTFFVILALISQFYTWQLVLQRGMGTLQAMGESVKLFFRYPGYTVAACFQAVCLTALLMLTVVGFGALFAGMFAIYQHKVTFNLIEPEEEAVLSSGNEHQQAGWLSEGHVS